MKLNLTIIAIILSSMFTVLAFSQAITSLQFADEISDKKEVTFGEVVKFFALTVQGQSSSFENDLNYLVRNNIAHGIKLKENDIVKMGTLSLMTARALNLKNTLLYNITGAKRYAVRACAAAGLIEEASGVLDKVSGEELIEIMRKIGQAY